MTLIGPAATLAEPELDVAGVLVSLASVLLAASEAGEGAREDPLTGALTTEALRERLGEEVERARRHRTALSCVMLGIDGLRAITARYGSQFGDTLVRHVAQIYLGEFRRFDRGGRLAKGEFAILLPGTGALYAEIMARRALARLHEIRIESGSEREQLTASVGVAVWQETESAEDLLTRAVRAMRDAQRADGNAISYGAPPPPAVVRASAQ